MAFVPLKKQYYPEWFD